MQQGSAGGRNRRGPSAAILLRVLGLAVAVAAVALCVRTLVVEWSSISASLRTADLRWIAAGAVSGAAGLFFLAVLWHQCLRVFGAPTRLGPTTAWFFAGELGKYLPGGIWPVVGRGELAHRGGVDRPTAYATTLLSSGLMCMGGAITCALCWPFIPHDGRAPGLELLVLAIIPVGLVIVHPAVFGPILGLARRISKGRIDLAAPTWGSMIRLVLVSVPTWLLIGASSAMVTAALGYEQQPARIAFAAVAAWIVGFLAIPVPAGAGVREVVFVLVCGLAVGPATAVAAVTRLIFVAIDAVGGIGALLWLRATGRSGSMDRSVSSVD